MTEHPTAPPPRPRRLTDAEASGELDASAPGGPASTGTAAARGVSRTTQVRLAVAAVTVAVLAIAWVTMGPTATTIRGKEFGYSVQGPEAVDITFDLAKPKDATVRCTLEALNTNFAQVGTKDVTIGPVDVSMSGNWSICARTRSSGICGGMMAADVEERAHHAVAAAHDDQGFTGDVAEDEVAGRAERGGAARAVPLAAEDRVALAREDLRRGVVLAG